MTIFDRDSHYFLSWYVVITRDQWHFLGIVCEVPAQQHFSDQFHIYLELHYSNAKHEARSDKDKNYSVEVGNAELRY